MIWNYTLYTNIHWPYEMHSADSQLDQFNCPSVPLFRLFSTHTHSNPNPGIPSVLFSGKPFFGCCFMKAYSSVTRSSLIEVTGNLNLLPLNHDLNSRNFCEHEIFANLIQNRKNLCCKKIWLPGYWQKIMSQRFPKWTFTNISFHANFWKFLLEMKALAFLFVRFYRRNERSCFVWS